MKKLKSTFSLLLILSFVFSPVFFANIFAHSQEVGEDEITGYQEWNQNRTIDKNIVVKPGKRLMDGLEFVKLK